MKTLAQYIQESMLKHIALEIQDNDIIYEKYGLYDGCKELINFIIDKLQNIKNFNKIEIFYNDVSDINNIVFDKLIISFKHKNDALEAAYQPKDITTQKINEKTKRFNQVNILFRLNTESPTILYSPSLKAIIGHELTHIFNDYRIQSICKGSFVKLFNTNEYKLSKQFNVSKSRPTVERELERALYMLNEYEKNGFIASLAEEIEEIKQAYGGKIENLIDANTIYSSIKGTAIYKSYMEIGRYINNYYTDNLTRFEKEKIIEHWNEIFNDNKTNLESIFKILSNKFFKLKRKLESTLPKKIAEELSDHNKILIEKL